MENLSAYKNWMKYEKYLLSGQWHVHTNYVDGENSVDEYCKRAVELRIPLIAFTEHVRKELTYNYQDLAEEIITAKKNYLELIILTGCEAKVLEDGSLDVSEDVLNHCEIVLMAFHSFPRSKDKYVKALKTALSNPKVDIWAHPTLFAKRNKFALSIEDMRDILSLSSKYNVLIERNMKYNVPDNIFLKIASNMDCKFVTGSDAHRVDELLKLGK